MKRLTRILGLAVLLTGVSLFQSCEPSAQYAGVYPYCSLNNSCTTTQTTATYTVEIVKWDSDATKVTIRGTGLATLTGVVSGDKLTIDSYTDNSWSTPTVFTGTGTVSENTITLTIIATSGTTLCTYVYTGFN